MDTFNCFNTVYGEHFRLIVTDDIVQSAQQLDIPHPNTANPMGICALLDDGIYIIINKVSTVGDLAHEIEHAVSFLWESRGIDKIEGVDECYAYMIGWLTNEFYTEFKRQIKTR